MKAVADVIARNAEDLAFIQIDAILGDLRAACIIQYQEYLDVIEQSIQKKLLLLQEILPRRGDDAFPKFLECLRQRRHVLLADRMERGNPVQVLKEYCDKNGCKVEYIDVDESGPPHDKKFISKVVMTFQPDEPSKTKKDAKAAAASLCLKRLGLV
ncbi:unnamed protein product [Darwinula stevensoni]|uniref:DRBM domain-containing protein n=1 Tax=Darwinula stevensoni TaxID=69355 RepID=A0A7R8XDT8_9CRUS|nr:unnamed protein product [Darwinula stevensoni]CAG0893833.1 unnamed protein product [Darwinula stevensoni]